MNSSESTAAIAEALAIFLAGLDNPAKTKDAGGGAKRYKYAELPDILDAVRADLGTQLLSLTMEAVTDGPTVGVSARIFHASGEWIAYGPLMLPAGNDAQSAGSALTYARRYLLCAMLNIAADEDDDGAKASKKSAAKKPKEDWGEKVDAPKVSGSEGFRGEGPTDPESTSPDTGGGEPTDTSGTVTPPSSGDEPDDSPAPEHLWAQAAAAKLTGTRALRAAVAGVKAGTLPGPMPKSQSDITAKQLAALIEKFGEQS